MLPNCKTSLHVGLVEPLRSLIASRHGPEEAERLADDIQQVQALRNQIISSPAINLESVQRYRAYSKLVSSLSTRLSWSEMQIQPKFRWYDSLTSKRYAEGCDFLMDSVASLCNAACLCAKMASTAADRHNNDGFKDACAYFQRAHQLYTEAKDGPAKNLRGRFGTEDLTNDGLTALAMVSEFFLVR